MNASRGVAESSYGGRNVCATQPLLGYRDVGCFGSPEIQTPNIDRLAAEGARFTDFYSAYCVCSASRAGLLTGCYQPRISMRGVLGPHTKTALHPDEVTIADMLKTKGYSNIKILCHDHRDIPFAASFGEVPASINLKAASSF